MQIIRGIDNRFTRRYVCACCWGDLGVERNGNPDIFYCLKGPERCSGRGFVTRRYAERRLGESRFELSEVRRNYPNLEGKRQPVLTEAQLLQSLGYV